MSFRFTTAIERLQGMTKPIRVVQGGTSAGKTEGIIALLIEACIHDETDPNCKAHECDVTVVAESIPALKDGALKIFKNTMQSVKELEWDDNNYNATDRIYKFPDGGRIQFKSFDTVGKAKAAGKRSHLFINECQYVPFPVVEELMIRTYKEVWFDYNPNNPFWIQDEIIPRSDAELLILTYQDNEATPARVVEDFERKIEKAFYDPNKDWSDNENIKSPYHANFCRVYIRGEIGSLEGVIFKNWSLTPIMPPEGLVAYGMDFGYTNDPTTLIACYEFNGERIFDEVIYRKGLATSELARMIKDKVKPHVYIYADSAEPKTIAELKSYGIRVTGATKGKDSINFGISILQEEPFRVTERSTNLIKELREYCWDVDKEGRPTQKPIGIYDHCIDAMRYLAIERLSKANQPRKRNITISSYH